MKTRKFAAPLLALAGLYALPLAVHAAPNDLPAADIPPAGPLPAEHLLPRRQGERLVRDMADGRAPLNGDVNHSSTAMCVDGTVSRSASPMDACLYHGGLDHWFGTPGGRPATRTANGYASGDAG